MLNRLERVREIKEVLLRLRIRRLFGERERLLPVARAGLTQALNPDLQRIVERGRAVLRHHFVDLAVETVETELNQLFKIDVRAGHAAVAVCRARALVALGQNVAVAVRKGDVQLARGVFLAPEHLNGLQRTLLVVRELVIARAHGERKLEIVEIIRVAGAQRGIATHLRGEADKIVLVAPGNAVVFIERHQNVLELEIEAARLAQVDIPAVLLVDAREFQRIVQFFEISLEHIAYLPCVFSSLLMRKVLISFRRFSIMETKFSEKGGEPYARRN